MAAENRREQALLKHLMSGLNSITFHEESGNSYLIGGAFPKISRTSQRRQQGSRSLGLTSQTSHTKHVDYGRLRHSRRLALPTLAEPTPPSLPLTHSLGGTVGLLLASRLARTPSKPRVLVLEAGADRSSLSYRNPSERYMLAFTNRNWITATQPSHR